MAVRKSTEKNVRKLAKIGKQSVGLTLPIEMLRELGWKERQRVVVKKVRGGVLVKDWKK